MKRFWNWRAQNEGAPEEERTLYLYGPIAEESWFDDDLTPAEFRSDLWAGEGDVTVWINSPGGDCIAAAQIYNMLLEYPGKVTVKVDGLAASAASVIAMAADRVLMSPVSMLMIHNPATIAAGDSQEMQRVAQMLEEVKESIINAYERKTGLSRIKIGHYMDDETWMNANKALELGFADEIMHMADETDAGGAVLYSRARVTNSLLAKIKEDCKIKKAAANIIAPTVTDCELQPAPQGRRAEELLDRLQFIKKFFEGEA